MACSLPKIELCISKGSTIDLPIRFESSVWRYIPITGIEQSSPVRITAPDHDIAPRWRGIVVNVGGMAEINTERKLDKLRDPEDYHKFDVVDANTVEINKVNAAGFGAYTSGGQIVVPAPMDLSDVTAARMQVNDADGNKLEIWTTGTGELEVDTTNRAIRIKLTAAASAALTWSTGVFDIELVRTGGVVDKACAPTSTITVVTEQTTDHP